jgi:hypothetical protein
VNQQHRQHGPLLGPPQLHPALAVHDLQGPEDPKLHRAPPPPDPPSCRTAQGAGRWLIIRARSSTRTCPRRRSFQHPVAGARDPAGLEAVRLLLVSARRPEPCAYLAARSPRSQSPLTSRTSPSREQTGRASTPSRSRSNTPNGPSSRPTASPTRSSVARPPSFISTASTCVARATRSGGFGSCRPASPPPSTVTSGM